MKTRVAIVGAGPAGLLLGHLLSRQGIDNVVLEARSRAYVESRIRAGVCEHGTVEVLREAGVGDRMDREGLEHEGIELRFGNRAHRIDFPALVGKRIMVYGQQEVVKDLIDARLADGAPLHFEAEATVIEGLDGDRPTVTFVKDGETHVLACDYVAGCDGFHGPSRDAVPDGILTRYERVYPFGWLGVLAEAPPSTHEVVYAGHEDGFALSSMRSPTLTRAYVQVDPDDDVAAWPDEHFWEVYQRRMATRDGFVANTGGIVDKGITAMRSFVVEPMQHGRLFLAGDSAHIVPPTGAKGMNLAVADVVILARAFEDRYHRGDDARLARYSEDALRRVWRAQHFSWWMTSMLHRFPGDDAYGRKLQLAQLHYTVTSEAAVRSLAENYVGWVDPDLDLG